MSPGRAPLLLRVLGHLLWLVLRLVILGLTGKWLAGTPAEALRSERERMAGAGADSESQSPVEEQEAPLSAEALRSGNLGVMDYYQMRNVIADTDMRESVGRGDPEPDK